MPDLDERCTNWGVFMRRQRSGNRVSLIWDGYYRAKHWGDDDVSRRTLDAQDAWTIERAWSDRRMFRLHKVVLSLHYVYAIPPPHACRVIKIHHNIRIRPSAWDTRLEEARDELQTMLDLQAKTVPAPGPQRPLAFIRIYA